MPKMKTKRAVAKRFRLTGSGKLMRERAFRRHILEKKSSVRTRRLGKDVVVDHASESDIRRLLGK